MAINYRLTKENREDAKYYGKWYARAVMTNRIDLRGIAEKIQENVSVKESDVYAVLIELVNVMKAELQASHAVVIDRLGTFRAGLSTSPAETAAAWNPATNVRSIHVNFLPEQRYLDGTGKGKKRTSMLLVGAKVQELPKNDVDKTDPENP